MNRFSIAAPFWKALIQYSLRNFDFSHCLFYESRSYSKLKFRNFSSGFLRILNNEYDPKLKFAFQSLIRRFQNGAPLRNRSINKKVLLLILSPWTFIFHPGRLFGTLEYFFIKSQWGTLIFLGHYEF